MPAKNILPVKQGDKAKRHWLFNRKQNLHIGPFRSRRHAGRFKYGTFTKTDGTVFYYFRAGCFFTKSKVVQLTNEDVNEYGLLVEAEREMGDPNP